MATIKAPTMHDRVYVGTHGNVSLEFGKAVLANAAVNDVVELLELPPGLKLVGFRLVTDGLGAGVSVDIKAGSKVLKASQSAAAKTQVSVPIEPVYLDDKAILSATIKGGNASGTLMVMPEYISIGLK